MTISCFTAVNNNVWSLDISSYCRECFVLKNKNHAKANKEEEKKGWWWESQLRCEKEDTCTCRTL